MAKLQEKTIIVDGAYKPDKLKLKQGVPARVTFERVSDQGCLEQIVIGDGQPVDLPIGQPQTFDIDTSSKGEVGFHCGMDMFRGTITIK